MIHEIQLVEQNHVSVFASKAPNTFLPGQISQFIPIQWYRVLSVDVNCFLLELFGFHRSSSGLLVSIRKVTQKTVFMALSVYDMAHCFALNIVWMNKHLKVQHLHYKASALSSLNLHNKLHHPK